MSEDIEVYVSRDGSSCYLESLARTRQYLKDTDLLAKLDKVISLEIDLAEMGAEKAKSEINKKGKNNVKPIHGV
jgi:hypothetical protein